MDEGKVLGIDYGHVRVGIAVSDYVQSIAFGRDSIKNKSRKYLLKEIREICKTEKIVKIVIGLPLNMEGKNTSQTFEAKKFGKLLEKATKIPVVYNDERLTSVESDGILNALGYRGPQKRNEKDKIAASIILQNYLDLIGKKGQNRGR